MNQLAILSPLKPTKKSPNRAEAKIVANARHIMALMHEDAINPKTAPSVRATIARSYALLGDAIRVWRGIPSPGQLRPDLDPVQLAKALKRQRSRSGVHDIQSSAFEEPIESAPEPDSSTKPVTTKEPTKEPSAEPETPEKTSKESLSERGPVTTGGGGEGTEEGGGV